MEIIKYRELFIHSFLSRFIYFEFTCPLEIPMWVEGTPGFVEVRLTTLPKIVFPQRELEKIFYDWLWKAQHGPTNHHRMLFFNSGYACTNDNSTCNMSGKQAYNQQAGCPNG